MVVSYLAITYIEQRCTFRMQKTFNIPSKYVDVMRQRRKCVDNASELDDYWNDEREVLLSAEWIGPAHDTHV